ncbi:hypothetical protein [Paenibacillus validus]|uniref:DUF3990 domain-containing protein n=1 Tax=Paenibacillus validus TaxID=44253 RepID=A0A7X3CS21_9BACL|nr:hypothetical protein [Paenibacillus validus]MUG71335.1 hypothetical protein [Paenibacillus validus]
MIELTLYHGNTESAIDQIVLAQTLLPHLKSTGDEHYLGDGYYFYHDDTQAKVWSIMKVTRNEKYREENWAVLKCTVRINEDHYMDLDLREHQDFFFQQMLRLNSEISEKKLDVDEYHDSFMCNHLANILNLHLISKTFPYKDKQEVLPPLFSNHRSKPYGITRHFRTEKQYCVINTDIILSFEKVMRGNNPKKRGVIL